MQHYAQKCAMKVAVADRSVIERIYFGVGGYLFVVATRVILGTMVGALAVTAAFAVPAIGAPDLARVAARAGVRSSFFTPASADPKLAALIARSGLGATPFRFTPADSRGQRRIAAIAAPVTAPQAVVTLRGTPATTSVGVVPFAYNLDGAAPKPRAVINGDVKFDLAASTTARKPMDLGTSLSGRRSISKFKSTTEKTVDGNTRLVTDLPNSSIDVGGSYSLSKNIDVTAGVRYKAQDRDRLSRLTDDARRDSQAVYVGTAFRF